MDAIDRNVNGSHTKKLLNHSKITKIDTTNNITKKIENTLEAYGDCLR